MRARVISSRKHVSVVATIRKNTRVKLSIDVVLVGPMIPFLGMGAFP